MKSLVNILEDVNISLEGLLKTFFDLNANKSSLFVADLLNKS